MRVSLICSSAIALSCLAASSAVAQSATLPPVDSTARWIDSIFAPFASGSSPGCAGGVTQKGRLVFEKGYGEADLEHDTPISMDTRFYIASLSKQFTAMSIVLLAQQHRLSLDDSIQKWVPEVPSFGAKITLRNLLHHTSGIRDYITLLAVSGWPTDGLLTEDQFLALVQRQKNLNFSPGDEFLYSNTGYALLAVVVRRASGKSLRDFAAERIFRPLGMTHTEFRDDHTALIPQRALGYQPSGSTFRLSQPELDVVGDGGVYSTVEDLAKWDANFTSGKVGGKAGIALMEAPGRLNDGQVVPYGLGLTLGDFHGTPTLSHAGAYGGYRATLMNFPERQVSVITLCNTAGAPSTLADQVASVVLGFAQRQRTAAAPVDLPTNLFSAGGAQFVDSTGARRRNDVLTEIAGSYYSDELELPVTLKAREGVLVLQRPRSEELRFVSVGDDLFTNSDKFLLRVVRNERGAVTGFRLTISRVRDLSFERK
jgi:CubicO group peptidase (beta-lactamase class C family)